jgi:hypothetical protein
MKKIALLVGLVSLCAGLFTAPAFSQATPVSGRTIVYPLENPPTTDAVTQPARFQRVLLGSWIMQALNLTTVGDGVYANCSAAPGTGLAVTISATVSGAACALYQVGVSDAQPLPPGYTPALPADPTVIVVAALQTGTTSPITFTAPGSNSVYWLVEAQVTSSDGDVGSRGFYNPITGAVGSQSVNTKRQDQMVYQTKEGTPGSSPSKPSPDSGWIPMFYVEIASDQTQVHSGDISAGDLFAGFSTGGGGCGGGCVTSLDTLLGDLTLGSSDSSITVTPSGTNIDLKATVTPGPQATPSPEASGCAFWYGSWPYGLDSNSCSGGGGGFTNLVCTAPVVCSPSAGPTPAVTVTTPTPLPCPTAGANVTITGTIMPACSIASSGGGGGGGFPWALRQSIRYANGNSGAVVATFASTPVSGDFLLALIGYQATTTISAPSGWTLWNGSTSGGAGVVAYYKVSDGTETGISATLAASKPWGIMLFNFSGTRTPDTSAVGGSFTDTNKFLPPALTSPTSGAAVITMADFQPGSEQYGILYAGDGTAWSWGANASTSGFASQVFGLWQNSVGTVPLNMPYFLCYGGGDIIGISLSLL